MRRGNPLARLLGKRGGERTGEDSEAQAKADRIEHHRRHVRNGPVKTGWLTTGQQRRMHTRTQRTAQRKVLRRGRRQWMNDERARAVLRAKLQGAGAIPYVTQGFSELAPASVRVEAEAWLLERFGERYTKTGEPIGTRDAIADAVATALAYYESGSS